MHDAYDWGVHAVLAGEIEHGEAGDRVGENRSVHRGHGRHFANRTRAADDVHPRHFVGRKELQAVIVSGRIDEGAMFGERVLDLLGAGHVLRMV